MANRLVSVRSFVSDANGVVCHSLLPISKSGESLLEMDVTELVDCSGPAENIALMCVV